MPQTVILEGPPPIPEGDDSIHAADHADMEALAVGTRTLMSLTAKRRPTPTEKKHVRDAIATYLERTEFYKARWHYLQLRRMQTLGVSAAKGGKSDCSEQAHASLFMGGKVAKVAVEDPSGLHWSGYGWTGTLLAANDDAEVDGAFLIGDFAIFGTSRSNTTHVTTCRKKGSASTAIFTSNGSEAGPYATRLHYRPDLLGVFRPWSLR